MTTTYTPEQQAAMRRIAAYLAPKTPKNFNAPRSNPKPSEWMERSFYIVETRRPIVLMPHQRSITEYALDPDANFQTIIYSAIKKSGKSAWAGAAGRYIAEYDGHRSEVICVGNDRDQAKGRSYQAILASIELDPRYNPRKREIEGYWRVTEREATHIPTSSKIKAISNDNRGEAGANPSAVLFTEIWGFTAESAKKLFAELTPPPTRPKAKRIIETYAGYEDESDLLFELYEEGLRGRRLTHDDIDWPFDDQPPIWVNHDARIFMYWDGVPHVEARAARRMPWQQDEGYYLSQRKTLPLHEYERLHEDKWQASLNEFGRPEWLLACREPIPELQRTQPCVLGVDASVTNDCTALALISRHVDSNRRDTDAMLRKSKVWYPRMTGGIDFEEVENTIREWCKLYNVVQVAYDSYQLESIMQRLRKAAVAWCNPFSQQGPRAIADKHLYDIIVQRRFAYDGDAELLAHYKNAAVKASAVDQEKMRLEKKKKDTPIDLLVATSMAAYEVLRLNL